VFYIPFFFLELCRRTACYFIKEKRNKVQKRSGGMSWPKHTNTHHNSNKKVIQRAPHHLKVTKPARAKNSVWAPRTADLQVLLHRPYTKGSPCWCTPTKTSHICVLRAPMWWEWQECENLCWPSSGLVWYHTTNWKSRQCPISVSAALNPHPATLYEPNLSRKYIRHKNMLDILIRLIT
jgi:hypothetical protein